MAWPDYHRADQTITATEASDHSPESIPGTENPMRIPSEPIRKQMLSIRIQ